MKRADIKIVKLESTGKNGGDMSRGNSWKAAECSVTRILKLGFGD